MGFFNSLKGQVGRDTGRAISNKVFGNRHATKYQRVDAQNTRANLKAQRDYELEILQQERENERLRIEEEKKRRNNLKLEKEIVNIISIKVPQKKEDLMGALNELSIMISANPWKGILEPENKSSNHYTDVVLKKYEQCLFSLKTKFPKEREIIYYENQYKKLKKERIKGKFLSPSFIFLILMIASIIWGVSSGYFERMDQEKENSRQEFVESIKSIFK